VTLRIASALADRGDQDAVAWLKVAVKKADFARGAGATLAANKVPVCPLVKAELEGANAAAQLSAAQALATAGEAACAPGLVKMFEDRKLKPDARSAAATALGSTDDPAAQAALATAAKEESNNAVKAAATLAQIRPMAGRTKMLSMVRLLKDPSIEIRSAASAGVVRAGGDSDFNDLYLLFKDTDPRPAEAVVRELETVPGDETNKMLGRLLRRPLVPVQKAAAAAIVKRRAKIVFPGMKPFLAGPDAEMRALALVAADDAQLAKAAADPKMGVAVYRALLARGERDRAADWLLAHVASMQPVAQADAMVDWLTTAETPPASAAKGKK
jgi:HEAT repeat protein